MKFLRTPAGRWTARLLLPALASALVLLAGNNAAVQADDSDAVVVSADVLSATNISIDPADPPTAGSCLPDTADVTDFGSIVPGIPETTGTDCIIAFGSSNNTATLLAYQDDGVDTAMVSRFWTTQNPGTINDMQDVAAVDHDTLWIVGKDGEIHKSVDGGANWTPQNSNTGTNLWGIDAVDDQQLVAVGGERIVTTADGGSNWAAQNAVGEDLKDVDMATSQVGWAVGFFGSIYKTGDGGATWVRETETAADEHYAAVHAVSDQVAWATADGKIRVTTNGSDWNLTAASPVGASTISGVHAIDADTAWVGIFNGDIYATNDGGGSWTRVHDATAAESLRDLEGLPDGSMYAVGLVGTILFSADGSSWTTMDSPATDRLWSVHMVDRSNGWIVGDDGMLLTLPAAEIQDYDDDDLGDDHTWTEGESMFGACLRSLQGAGVSEIWSVDDTPVVNDGNCAAGDTDPWNGLAQTSADGTAAIAETTSVGTTDAVAHLRFGIRAALDQPMGQYEAHLIVEAVASSP